MVKSDERRQTMSSFLDESAFLNDTAPRTKDESSVLSWRTCQLQALGFDEHQAFQLAITDLDLNQARQLVAGGCPLQLVPRICL
jgi:hypothetical protein